MNWIFKIDDSNLILSLTNKSPKVLYQFTQRRNFRGEVGDQVVFLIKKSDWIFTHYGTISSIQFDDEPDSGNSDIKFSITVTEIKEIEEPLSIDDFSYTLLKIYKWYNDPIRHIRSPYSRLDKSDFDAIISGRIFISRTAFGKTLNALHIDHRVSFLQNLIQENPDLYARGNNYIEAFALLKEYIQTYIYPDVKMVSEIGAFLLDLNSEEAGNLGFADPENFEKESDNIMEQVKLCNDFNLTEYGIDYIDFLFEEIKNATNEEIQFSNSFNNRPLPIYLN